MILRFWLRRNFLGRGLRWLRERAGSELFGWFHLPSLLPRFPLVTPETEAASAAEALTDETVVEDGRELRVVSSDLVSLKTSYIDWIGPLMQLPEDAPTTEWDKAFETVLGDKALAPYFFPVRAYLDSLKSTDVLDVELVHRCRAARTFPHTNLFEPAVILLYNRKDPR
jgi:hypothetical protein